jgi:hypothetical protein
MSDDDIVIPGQIYTPSQNCFTCLEEYTTFVDFGMSDQSSQYLAKLRHVVDHKPDKYLASQLRFIWWTNNEKSKHGTGTGTDWRIDE